jgi:hypothetical protein
VAVCLSSDISTGEEEQSPGDSGLTAGTISLSDRSSQEMSGSSSGGR